MAQTGQENRILVALAYPIPLIGLIIILTDLKKDAFARYHGWQSVFWGIAWIVLYVAFSIVLGVFLFTSLWGLIFLLYRLMNLAYLVLSLYYAYRTYQGEQFTIPVVSQFSAKYAQG